MRVIAGKCRSMPLLAPKGEGTRPTMDRIKETLFNMLMPRIQGCRFLDLFAGSGAIGIEALSRGANSAVFVERDKQAAEIIRKNLAFTKLAEFAELFATDARHAIRLLSGRQFDLVYMDPPYKSADTVSVMQALFDEGILKDSTLLVLEADLDFDLALVPDVYTLQRQKRYKTNQHLFFTAKERTSK